MFTGHTHTHTHTQKNADFPWVSQAQSCCCGGFSLQSCQSRSDFPNYPPPPVAGTRSGPCLLQLWYIMKPRDPTAGHLLPRVSRESCCCGGGGVGGMHPREQSGDQSKCAWLLGTLPEGSLANHSVVVLPGPSQAMRWRQGPWQGALSLEPVCWFPGPCRESHWVVTCNISCCHCTMAASSMGIQGTLSSTFLN
ncbi:hypothetical protein mRhiFer1_009929 [Rhinolophus ferrumequinum]|uniref:Uncharacterized protein n=1 Tax=Rhinolophus ferrumequinum TaxID=59479 RepID=A0A7J7YIA8_RHIFE|nr:hypothetical protein mRhiFer1_009929 [Rhinolophus ferrumequinum]